MVNKCPVILIQSKREIENFLFSDKIKYGIISISGDMYDDANISEDNSNFVFFTRVSFDDVEKVTSYYNMDKKDYDYLYPMNYMQAKILAYDIKKYWNKIDVLIVQCNAGISRSAGVAAAISKYFTGDDFWIFNSYKYRPNMNCYTLMLKELEEIK